MDTKELEKNEKLLAQTGNRIRQLRTHVGLSQEALAFAADISTVYLSQLERGMKAPTIVTVNNICTALGISLSEFFISEELRADDKYNLAYQTIYTALRDLPPDSALKLSVIIQELSQLNK